MSAAPAPEPDGDGPPSGASADDAAVRAAAWQLATQYFAANSRSTGDSGLLARIVTADMHADYTRKTVHGRDDFVAHCDKNIRTMQWALRESHVRAAGDTFDSFEVVTDGGGSSRDSSSSSDSTSDNTGRGLGGAARYRGVVRWAYDGAPAWWCVPCCCFSLRKHGVNTFEFRWLTPEEREEESVDDDDDDEGAGKKKAEPRLRLCYVKTVVD